MVMTGKDRGKTGVIVKVLQKDNKVIIEGVNKRVKHVKGKNQQPGERVEFNAPIHVSNISVIDPKDGKPTRVGYKYDGNQKLRIAKKSGEVVVAQKSKKKTTSEK